MKILYGIQGTGNGHLSRSREIVKELKKEHDVFCIFSGRKKKDYFDIEELKPYKIFKGLTFQKKNGKVDISSTILNVDLYSFIKDVKKLKEKYDLVITDFEPITSLFSRNNNIPSIGISHQYAFNSSKYLRNDLDPITKYLVKNFAPADLEIGLHWMSFEDNIKHPIINSDVESLETYNDDYYIVYLPWEEKETISSLKDFSKERFVVYDKRKILEKNIVSKKLSRENFIHDLSKCKGVVCSSGFQLLTEAIFLNKKIFTIPMKNQTEQVSNAKLISSMALGQVGDLKSKEGKKMFSAWLKRDIKPNYVFSNNTKKEIINIISSYS